MLPLEAGDPQTAGPFRLVARLGSGGMGQVFLGKSAAGRRVAVKLVRTDLAALPGFRDRFRREIQLAMRAGGFWAAPVIDADPDATVPWIASQYVDGPSLAERVEGQGPLSVPEVLPLGVGLAEALDAFHQGGLVHRDLKPSNVLLADDGPRVIDFGISKALETTGGTDLTKAGTVLGTPGFMSPEQALGQPAGPPSDVFSLGSLLVYSATGNGAFGDGASHALLFRVVYEDPELGQVPGVLRELVLDCLRKAPGDRPGARELITRLAEAQQALGVHRPTDVDTAKLRREDLRDETRVPAEQPVTGSVPAPGSGFGSAPGFGPGPRPGFGSVPGTAPTPEPGRSASTPMPAEAATPAAGNAEVPPASSEFTVQDGGPGVFFQHMHKPLRNAALSYGIPLVLGLAFKVQILPLLGTVLPVVFLLLGARHALPYLKPRALWVRADGLSVRHGRHKLSVPWRDIASVTFAGDRHDHELALTATLSDGSRTRVPAGLSANGSKSGGKGGGKGGGKSRIRVRLRRKAKPEPERALKWTLLSSSARVEGLESALRTHAGTRFALTPS